jgi:hypothetical protein
MKQTKVQKSARGEECTLRIAGICTYDVETTVLCHVGFNYGTGKRIRVGERNAVYACSACHDAIDGRHLVEGIYELGGDWRHVKWWYIARALVRTAERRDELGI